MVAGSKRFIVLPDHGYKGRVLSTGMFAAAASFDLARRPGDPLQETVNVVDRIGGGGPMLVEASEEGELAIKAEFGTRVKVIPLIYYPPPDPRPVVRTGGVAALDAAPAAAAGSVLTLKDRADGTPLGNALVIAFTNYRHRIGASARSGDDGRVTLGLQPGTQLERLYVYPKHGYWSQLRTGVVLGDLVIGFEKIRLDDPRHVVPLLYGSLTADAGDGVRVAVIDTGVQRDHPHLSVAGGRNCVFDEVEGDPGAADDYDDVAGHGTHVAGIIGANGPLRGVAPKAEIRAYRVFPKVGDASNFDIMKAIDRAVEDGCHIVNLSLGGTEADDGVRGAIGNALSRGVLVVAATGNDGRDPVRHPAAYEPTVAVSAMGLRGTFPADGTEQGEAIRPFSTVVPAAFLAGFSNVGPQVDFTGPGVGVVSTYLGGTYTSMNGTSMACPAVAGFAAALLSADPALLASGKEDRAVELIRRLSAAAVRLGLGRDAEGLGLPLPAGVGLPALMAALPA
jgi:subtilisin